MVVSEKSVLLRDHLRDTKYGLPVTNIVEWLQRTVVSGPGRRKRLSANLVETTWPGGLGKVGSRRRLIGAPTVGEV